MKVKLSKRLRSGLAMLLAIVMVVGMLPASALAADVSESAVVDTFAELKTAIEAGGTVTLGDNIIASGTLTIPAGVTTTLDLNGYTISGTHGSDYALIHVKNSGELTVKDSGADGTITCTAGGNNTGATVWVEGALVLESGTIELTGSWSLGFAVDVRPNAWGTAYTEPTTFTMNGGKIVASDTGVRVASNSSDDYTELGVSFTMNGGTIDSGWDAVFVQHLYNGDLDVNISKGTISGENSVLRVYGDTAGSDVDMDITGGSFVGNVKVADAYVAANPITISGGSFKDADGNSVDVSAYVDPDCKYNPETGTVAPKPLYVSLGDSMTNGYGLEGYNHNSGVEDYGDGSYANQFAEEYGFNHTQLAMSGIRTEDIHWLLELDYTSADAIALINKAIANLGNWSNVADEWNEAFGCGDFWTVNEICDHSRTNATYYHIAGGAYEADKGCTDHGKVDASFFDDIPDVTPGTVTMGEKVAVIAKYYQEHVADADIISLSVGNGNLGVFGFGRILEVIGFSDSETYLNYNYEDVLRECEPEMQARLIALIGEIKPAIQASVNNDALVNVMLYIAASLAMNYAGTLDAILQMNSDVEIILIPVMNTFGENLTPVEGQTTIGDLLALVIDPLNKFIAGLPAYMQVTNHEVYENAKFYWAESSKSVECMVDTYVYPLANPIVRDRFVESIVGDDGSGMIWGLLNGDPDTTDDDMVVTITLPDITEYEVLDDAGKLAYAAGDSAKATSISMYLAFEKAIVTGKDNPVTLSSVFSLGSILGGNPFGPIMEEFAKQAAVDGAAKLDDVCAFMALQAKAALENEINTKVRAFLVSKGQSEEEAKAVSVTVPVTGEQIKAIVTAADDAAKAAAAKVIAQNAVKAVVAVLGPIYKEMTVAGVVEGLTVLLPALGTSVADYDAALHESEAGHVYDAEAFVNDFCADAAEDYAVLKGHLAISDDAVWTRMMTSSIDEDTTVADALASAAQNAGVVQTEAGVETAVKTLLNSMVGGDAEAYISGMLTGLVTAETAGRLCTLLVMPETLGTVVAESELKGLLALFARCVIGNGIGAHPSQDGHNTLAEAVVATYGERTAEDETDDNLDFIENLPVIKAIVSYLTAQGYLNDDQILGIAFYAYELLKDGMDDGEETQIADYIFETLFYADITDADRVEIIGNVYAILDEYYSLSDNNANIQAFENIATYLYNNEYMDDEQAFLIVNYVYWTVSDGVQDGDIMDIIRFVYLVIFDDMRAAMFADLDDIEDPSLTAGQKMEILMTIYNEFKEANPEVVEQNPEIEVIENLYEKLTTEDENGETLLSDEQIFAIVDTAVKSIVVEEKPVQEAVQDITAEVNVQIETIPTEKKLEILEKIGETVEELNNIPGGSNIIPGVGGSDNGSNDSMASVAEFTKYFAIVKKVVANLRAEGLWTDYADEKFNALTGGLITKLMNGGAIEPVELIDDAYSMVFNQPGHTLEQKIRIVEVIYETLDEEGVLDGAIDYVDEHYYQDAIAKVLTAENIELALDYIDAAIAAVEAAELAVDVYPVDAEFAAVKEALLAELAATVDTLEAAKAIIASNELSELRGVMAAMLTLKGELYKHVANIAVLAEEIGIVAEPYITEALETAEDYVELIKRVVTETYASVVNGCEEFAAEYAAWVEEMGKLADKVDPVLGAAVRKYLTETPAESLAILYAYGDEALTKLIVDAAAAGKDVYTIAAALAKVFYDYGEDIYNELLASGEYKLIVNQIEALKAEIEVVLAKIAAAPADSVSNYEVTLGELYAKLRAAYGDVYPIVLQAAGQVDAELPGQIDTLMTALGDTLGVVGNAAGAYGEWFVGRTEAMGGALLTVLVENTDELLTTACPIIDEIIWAVLNGVNDYLYDTCKAIDAQIWVQIGILEAELKALKAELENAAGEAYEAIMAQIAVVEAKLNALKAAVEEGIYTNYLAAIKALGELKNEVINLANALKAAAMDEAAKAYDAIVDALADLEKALPTVLAEALETVKEKLGQFGEYLAGKVVEAVKKYAPELADAIYNYLYNNPDEVIAFFTEYGDEMLALAQEYGDEALAVIGVVLYLYGEDIVDYVVENHEAILGAIANWIDVHGENTAELIQVYAEALGLCGAVREQIDVLENAVLDLEAKAQAQIAALQAQIDALNAQLQTAVGEAKAEIEAKIAELEAQIEAIKASVEAKIAEVKAAIAELEAAVDAAIKQGLADIAALKAAIENLDEKVAELIEAAKQAAIEELKAAAANVEAALKNLDATVEQLVGEAYVELKALLADAVDYLIDATVEAVKKYAPELADAIYNYLYHNPDEVIAFFTEYGDKLLALAEKYGDEALAVIGGVLYLYGEEIADYVMDHAAEIMDTMVEWVETHGENAWALIQVYLEELGVIEAIENTVENLVTNLEMMAAGAIEKAEELIAQGAARIEAEIAKLEAAKDALIDELEDLKASLEEELKDASEEVKAEVEKAIAEVEKAIAAVEKAIAELEAKLAELKQIAEDIADAAQKVIDAIAMIGEDFQGAVKALKSALEELADALEALEEFVAELNAAIDGVQKEIAEIIAVVTEINEKIGKIVTGTIETLEAVEAVINDVVATIREVAAAIDQVVADLKAAVFNAKYVVLPKCVYVDGLNYVALGGATAKVGGYVDILAAILGENFTVSYENHASAELAYADQLDYVIANAAAIAGADFITYQMDANEIVKNMVDVIIAVNMGGEYTSPDWSEYIDFATVEEVTGEVAATKAEIMKYLDEESIAWIASVEANVIAELEEVLVENGLTDEAIELAKPYVESLVYNMVAYAMETAEAIEAVKTINPTAPVVLVGMYNTLDDVVVKMGGAEINLGDFFAYVVDAVDMYNLIYAVVSGNVTYVDVSEAAVDPAVIDIDEYMGLYVVVEKLLADVEKLTASINPSDLAGMQAIVDQINAINAQINALVETANETYAYFMSIIANSANDEGHTYIAEQIANAILVVEHSPVTGHNCDTCGAKLSDCVDDDHDHNCDICGATMGTHEDTDKDHVCDYGCSETIGTCEDADKDHACDYGCDKVYGEHVDTNKDHVCDYGCSETIGTCADADKDHACDYGCDKVYGTCEDKDPVDGKCDYGCGKDFHPEVSVPEIPVDEEKGVIGFEIDEDAGILFMDTVQTGMSVEDFVALLKLHVDTEYDADGCDVDIVGDVNGLIATGTQVTVSAKNLAGVDSVTYDIVIVGDTNGDGKVSSGDATLIYQHFCGTLINALNELQLLAGDTNGNDRLESGDATKIFAKYVGAGYETVLK